MDIFFTCLFLLIHLLFILQKVDAILNAFCNDYIYPEDASCCKDLERITPLQFNAFAVLGTW